MSSLFSLLLLLLTTLSTNTFQVIVSAQNAYTVYVGLLTNETLNTTDINNQSSWQFMRFYPSTLNVAINDRVRFQFQTPVLHTVTYDFNNYTYYNKAPQYLSIYPPTTATTASSNHTITVFNGTSAISSGALSNPNDYTLIINAPSGIYRFYDAIRMNMTFNLTVLSPSSAIQSPTQIQNQVILQQQVDIKALRSRVVNKTLTPQNLNGIDYPFYVPQPGDPNYSPLYTGSVFKNSNGQLIYQVLVGYSIDSLNAVKLRFFPTTLHINVNDTVLFDSTYSSEPHFITFNYTGVVFNNSQIDYLTPTIRKTYNGSGIANSGQLLRSSSNPDRNYTYPTQYALQFTTEGRYRYIDQLHVTSGMYGFVVVHPPNTINGSVNPSIASVGKKTRFMNFRNLV